MKNSASSTTGALGKVYLWIPDQRDTLRGRVTTAIMPLQRLDACGEGRGRLWGQFVRVRNGGEINEPLASGNESRIQPIGDAVPNMDGNFIFEPGRGGGRIDKVNWDKASALTTEFLESGVPFPEPQFR